jgi:branched-chain amino acid transport system substrate-binding protein
LALISISRAVFCLPARAADPVKVGFSMALTGAVAQNGKQLIIALELWRDDVNARGGLLGPAG